MLSAPLYSDERNSRPNAPANVIVRALILKELNGLTDDEILGECESDFRYQYALHTTSYEDQPLSDRTFSRSRERNAAYELVTGKDLIHDCIVSLADSIREYMDIAFDGQAELLEGLHDHEDASNRNRVVYHEQSTSQGEKIQKIINDTVALLPKCKDAYDQTEDHQLLQRAIDEQTKDDGNGQRPSKNRGVWRLCAPLKTKQSAIDRIG